jgi:putative membrane protein
MMQPATQTAASPAIETLGRTLINTMSFVLLGILLFGIAFFIIVKVSPFSIRKEIEEDQNTSLSIIIGSVFIGIALIIAAAIHG